MSEIIATTARLYIRKIENSDLDFVYNLSQESLPFSCLQESEEEDKLRKRVVWNETNKPDTYNGMIFLKSSGDFVGKICMQNTDCDLPELGIDIMKVNQNHGYGPEAIIAFCNKYSANYGIGEVKVRIMDDNVHSIHVFEKLGAEYKQKKPYFSDYILNVMKEQLPGEDLSELFRSNVREYILRLPVSGNR